MTSVVVMGAGGKMGRRVSNNLRGSDYEVRHVEVSPAGRERLARDGFACLSAEQALADADAIILAVPDNLIGTVAHSINHLVRPGAMIIALDAAAPFAGELPQRGDLAYFVTHPCHPSIFNDETDAEARRDYFGGVRAKQNLVCALMQGPEEAYALGEAIARRMFAPVMRAHRLTVGQMAILEPVLSETVSATCISVIREATDEAIRRGVPEEAAMDFILGHLNITIAILFGAMPGARFSDGANAAVAQAKKDLFQADWKKVFEPEGLAESIRMITRPKMPA
jgi:hypothetical protein